MSSFRPLDAPWLYAGILHLMPLPMTLVHSNLADPPSLLVPGKRRSAVRTVHAPLERQLIRGRLFPFPRVCHLGVAQGAAWATKHNIFGVTLQAMDMLAVRGMVLQREVIRVQSRCQGGTMLGAVEPKEIAFRANGRAVFEVAVGAGGFDAGSGPLVYATL